MKKAFTLAEILITLGVIGIVAAMTIPNLIQKNFERTTIAKLRETQSLLSQAVRMAEEEYGNVEGWGLTGQNTASANIIYGNLKPFLKIGVNCGTLDSNEICVTKGNYLQLSGATHGTYWNRTDCYKIRLLNGSTIFWKGPQDAHRIITFWIDVNGKKLPNTYGKDLFVFSYENQSIRPLGAPDSDSPWRNSCKLTGNGWGCAYYVLHNNNMNYLHK